MMCEVMCDVGVAWLLVWFYGYGDVDGGVW